MSKKSDPPLPDTYPPITALPVSDNLIQAYVDGQIGAPQRALVEAYMAERPELAAKVAGYRYMNEDMHNLFDQSLQEQVPQHLIDIFSESDARVSPAPSQRASRGSKLLEVMQRLLAPAVPGVWRVSSYVVTLAWLGMGVAVGWQLQHVQPRDRVPPMVKHAAVAYVTYASELIHPVEVRANEEDHLEAWLTQRLGIDVKAAKLDQLGFSLMGGRLLAGTQRPVAQFMYEDKVGRRLTLYIKTQEMGYDQSAAFKFAQEGDVKAFYWINGGTGFVLSGILDRPDLLRVARAIYQQLNTSDVVPGYHKEISPVRQNGKTT